MNALETNISGIITIIPANWTTSGRRSRSPISPNNALIAPANTTSTTTAATASTELPWNSKPKATAATPSNTARARVNTASLIVRATPGKAARIGRAAKRSCRPLV